MASATAARIGSRLRPPPNAPVLLEEEATDLKGDIVTQGLKIINTAMPCPLILKSEFCLSLHNPVPGECPP